MTPKEKAKELVGKYVFYTVTDFSDENFEITKECALIAVNELISISDQHKIVFSEQTDNTLSEYTEKYYWQKVRDEIKVM